MNLYVPEELHEQIRQPVSGDRSKALFSVIAQLIKREVPDEIIERVIYAHPKGIGVKYADRHDLDTEIARVRYKTADPFAAVVEELNEQYAVVDDNGKTCVVYRRW